MAKDLSHWHLYVLLSRKVIFYASPRKRDATYTLNYWTMVVVSVNYKLEIIFFILLIVPFPRITLSVLLF